MARHNRKNIGVKQATKELGASGLRINHGMVFDEFIPELKGYRAVRKYREMSVNEGTIGAILHAMDMLLRAVEWRVDAADDSDESAAAVEFVESMLEDMDGTFEEFISEVLSFLVYGWAYFEVVYKRRADGRIGIKKLAPRSQNTLVKWEVDENGEIAGMHQRTVDGREAFIPIDKALHFRTVTHNDNPEGMSVLRRAYRSYWFLTNIQQYEAIAIERELNGLPVMRIPSDVLSSNDATQISIRNKYEQIARDVKFNEQGFAMLPSDTYPDAEGNPSNVPLVQFELMASQGSRDIDTDKVIKRYQTEIARTVLADFIMLGQSERGSFALSKSKSDLFLRSLEGYLNSIASILNRKLLPAVWKLNGFSSATMPKLTPGEVAPRNLEELGDYVQRIAASGVALGGDVDIEEALLEAAGLPTGQREDDPDILGMTDGEP